MSCTKFFIFESDRITTRIDIVNLAELSELSGGVVSEVSEFVEC